MSDTNGVWTPTPPDHAHRKSHGCPETCPMHHTGGYRVYPDEWPDDAEAIASEISDIRHLLTVQRQRIDKLGNGLDMDGKRSMADARGAVQGAIVMLYGDLERWRQTAQIRAEVAELLQLEKISPGPCATIRALDGSDD